jgi:glycerol-3-phosphate dehydrogenase (NAD(P)+)
VIAVIGGGAMGTALAIVHVRAGMSVALLGTKFDDASIAACKSGRPHPALGITMPAGIECHHYVDWDGVPGEAERIVLAVSSDGLADIVAELAGRTRPAVKWVVATKGWDKDTLRTPSAVVAPAADSRGDIGVLGGPALAPEIVAGAPTAMVCASTTIETARTIADTLSSGGISMTVTDDVAGVEIAAAYKNVIAVAVGMCEGLSERMPERVYVHRFANARAAMFALGLRDMSLLAQAQGGRPETILGLAGAGDLYVTCLGGRNGNFGRLLGEGQTPEQARATIGSTVEGVANTKAALALADRLGVTLPTAAAVDSVLSGETSPESAITTALTAFDGAI